MLRWYNNIYVINHPFRKFFPHDDDHEPSGMEHSKTMLGIAVIGEFLHHSSNPCTVVSPQVRENLHLRDDKRKRMVPERVKTLA